MIEHDDPRQVGAERVYYDSMWLIVYPRGEVRAEASRAEASRAESWRKTLGVLLSLPPSSGLHTGPCLTFVCGCWRTECRPSSLWGKHFLTQATSCAPVFLLCLRCEPSESFRVALRSTETTPAFCSYPPDGRREREVLEIWPAFCISFETLVATWWCHRMKKPVVLWADGSNPKHGDPEKVILCLLKWDMRRKVVAA